jgi:hypothetical protein
MASYGPVACKAKASADNACLLFSGTVSLIGLPTKNWGVRPAFLCPADLSPNRQQNLRDLALARSKNNALLALRWRMKKPTATQIRAGMHMIQSDRCVSDFNLDKTIVYRNKRTKALSRLETMAPVLLRKVLLLGDEVYENWRPLCGSFGHDCAGV